MAQADPVTRARAFADRLVAALGDNVRSVLLYGSAARGDYAPGSSDVNLLVLLSNASAAALRPATGAIARWVRDGNVAPLIFSEAGWRRAADVFPIEVEDMRAAHRVLHGADPLADVTTTNADLRRQLERELRGKLLHLRAAYAAAAEDGKALEALLAGSAGAFLVLCRAFLRLTGTAPPADRRTVIERAAQEAGFDPDAFEWPLTRLGGDRARRLAPHDDAATRYIDAVEQFVRFVDEHPAG